MKDAQSGKLVETLLKIVTKLTITKDTYNSYACCKWSNYDQCSEATYYSMNIIWRNNQATSKLSLETFCTWMAFCVEYANATLATCKNYSYDQTLENALIIASENKAQLARKA